MVKLSQDHLNEQLTKFCNIDAGTFRYVHVLSQGEPLPIPFDGNTIYIQKEGKNRRAFWSVDEQLNEKKFPSKISRTVTKHLPESGGSYDKRLLNKLLEILNIPVKKHENFLSKEGNCNGWSFLYAYYESTGRINVFNALRRYISKWDGTIPLSPLKPPLNSIYGTGERMLTQVVNDLAWFQHSSNVMASLYGDASIEKITQENRTRQYSMLRDPNSAISTVNYYGSLDAGKPTPIPYSDFIDLLKFYGHWREGWVDITINIKSLGSHSVSAYITSDGGFNYFDPNSNKEVRPLSAEECVNAMLSEYEGYEIEITRANLHKFSHFGNVNVMNEHLPFNAFDEKFAKTVLENAVKWNQYEFADVFIRDYINPARSREFLNEVNVLSNISEITSTKMIDTLVYYGADVNKIDSSEYPPLHIACSAKNTPVAFDLIQHGADMNAQAKYGLTPLHIASQFAKYDFIKELVEKSMNPMAVEIQGLTPLHYAAKWKNISALAALLESGKMDVNAKDSLGNTALHYAVRIGYGADKEAKLNQIAVIHLLRKYGANLDEKNKAGDKPIDVATFLSAKSALANVTLKRADAVTNLRQAHPLKPKSKVPSRSSGRRPSQEENVPPTLSNNMLTGTSGTSSTGPVVTIGKLTRVTTPQNRPPVIMSVPPKEIQKNRVQQLAERFEALAREEQLSKKQGEIDREKNPRPRGKGSTPK